MSLLDASRGVRRGPAKDMSGIFVPGVGPAPARLMFIGKRPGLHEANYRRPLVGDSGREFDRYLREIGVGRREVFVTNLVRNFTGEDDLLPAEVERDTPALWMEIEEVQPEIIVSLGADATKFVLALPAVDMEMVNGIPFQAVPYPGGNPTWVFPILHPASGLHDTDAIAWVWDGFQRLAKFMAFPHHHQRDRWPTPYYTWKQSISLTPGKPTALDTEGWKHRPYSIQYTQEPGMAAVVKVANVDAPDTPTLWLMHNAIHDILQCEEMGMQIAEGSYQDTMIKAYLIGMEPKGLKPLAFRLAGMAMADFSELIQSASDSIAIEYLHGAAAVDWGPAPEYPTVERDPKTGNWVPKIKQPQSMNRRIQAIINDVLSGKVDKAGNLVDVRKRWKAVVEEHPTYDEVVAAIGPMPLASLDDVTPDSKVVNYAGRDADAVLRINPMLDHRVHALGLDRICHIDHAVLPMVTHMVRTGMMVDLAAIDSLAAQMDHECQRIQAQIKVITGYDVNPNSGDQVAGLIFDRLGLKSRKLTKSRTRLSTNDKVLMALRAHHPVVPLIMDYRERSKIKDSFCKPIKRQVDRKTGRIYPNIRYTSVSQGRFSCTDPNLMAIPVRSDLGKRVRACFIAPPGRILATWDLNQVEMRFMAHESADEALVGAYNRREDIHLNTAERMFNKPKAQLHKVYHRYPAKRTGFGIITGITGLGLVDQMALAGAEHEDGSPWTEDECDELIRLWLGMYPGVETYMDRCAAEARRYNYVRESIGGRIRWLPGIHSDLERIRAESKRQSHSFKISGGATSIMKMGMARTWEWVKHWRQHGMQIDPLLQVHDELIMELPEGEFDEIDHIVQRELCCKGEVELLVPLEAAGCWGINWGALEK